MFKKTLKNSRGTSLKKKKKTTTNLWEFYLSCQPNKNLPLN